jgi:hypothetical protein
VSDARLREAERSWQQSGTVEDEARFLLQRVRAEALLQAQLELAAACGHQAAEQALATTSPLMIDAYRIAHRLAPWGRPVLVRLAVEAAGHALVVWDRHAIDEHGARTEEGELSHAAVRAARRWLEDPSPTSEAQARVAAELASSAAWCCESAAGWCAAQTVFEPDPGDRAAMTLNYTMMVTGPTTRAAVLEAMADWALNG